MKNEKEGESYFSMDTIKDIANMTSIQEAKSLAMISVISSSAKTVNKNKAKLGYQPVE